MVWCTAPEGLKLPFEEVQQRVQLDDGILLGSAYDGPRGRDPWGGTAGRGNALRFVTHMQTPLPACRALLGALRKAMR